MQALDSAVARGAIVAMYETHFDCVFRYLTIRIGNPAEAERLAAEVFIHAGPGWRRDRDTGELTEAWLFRIAHNVTEDYLKASRRRPYAPFGDALEFIDHRPDTDPLKQLERAELARQMEQTLRKLNSDMQQVIALRFGAGLDAERTAEVLRKTPSAVRQLQSEALKKLRALAPAGASGPAATPAIRG